MVSGHEAVVNLDFPSEQPIPLLDMDMIRFSNMMANQQTTTQCYCQRIKTILFE
jgi:hypothetical protein